MNLSPPRIRWARRIAYVCAAVSILLLGINSIGMMFPLRSPDVDQYRDFAGQVTTRLEDAQTNLKLAADSRVSTAEFVTTVTRIFHDGIAHISPRDVERNGTDHYRIRVPVTENWILYALSFIKPDTYMDYEFCDHRRALRRGVGRCGQQALAVVSFLSEHEVDTGFIALGGHAVATARVDEDKWYILDPDYGGVIPYDLMTAEKDPDGVLDHYWSAAARTNGIHRLYAPDNEIKYGGPEVRYPRACRIETVAYVLKWLIPVLSFAAAVALISVARRRAL